MSVRISEPWKKLLKSEFNSDYFDVWSSGNGCDDTDALILGRGGFDGTTVATWSPVTRTDIAWNFEKFLFDKDGKLVKRYSRYYPTKDIKKDIDALL